MTSFLYLLVGVFRSRRGARPFWANRGPYYVGGVLWWVALAALALPPGLRAQSAGDLQRFRPGPGILIGASVSDPAPIAHGYMVVGARAHYAHGLVDGSPRAAPGAVTDLATFESSLSLGLFGVLELGAVVPISLARVNPAPVDAEAQAAVGDARLQVKARLWQQGPILVGANLLVSLPTASRRYPFGDAAWSFTPAATFRAVFSPLTVAASAGLYLRDPIATGLEVADDAMRLSAAAEWWFVQPVAAFGEVQVDLALAQRPRARDGAEVLGGIAARLGRRGLARVGLGMGLPDAAQRALGVPDLRLTAAVSGVLPAFPCRAGPEDLDGFRDEDQCADLDNDADGLADSEDRCPNDAEDRDGFRDGDGCPDPDDDADGIADADDRCPRATEDWDGFDDTDGCPEPDNDQDGVADGYDVCGMEPEDLDGFEDGDGCPEPGPQPATVTIARDRILVSERIYFEHGRDVIRTVSAPVLEQIADAISGLPRDRHVVVVGHTDDRGSRMHNADLSLRRAEAVRDFLIARGVSADRLTCEGRGGLEPVGSNRTPEGRAMNRRVEFRLAQVREQP